MDKHLSSRTMVGKHGRTMINDILKIVFHENIEGDLVQCGVWRGGIAGLMLLHILESEVDSTRSNRKLWLYDTFEGMPSPGENDCEKAKNYYQETKNDNNEFSNWCNASINDVKDTLKYVSEEYDFYTRLIQGKVEDTLSDSKNLPKKIALLHLDTDWYSSTKIELEVLFQLICNGGFLVVDDYQRILGSENGWEGCTKAVDDFFGFRPSCIENFAHNKILFYRKI